MGVCKREHTDPRRPKRPLSAYIMFYSDFRSKNPNSSVSESAKDCAKMWRKMKPSERNTFVTKARTGMTKYRARISRYRRPSQEELCSLYGVKPKGFVNSYAFFVKYNFHIVMRLFPGNRFADNSRALAKKWYRLTDRQRVRYVELFKIDRIRYGMEMQRYKDGKYTHSMSSTCCVCCTKSKSRRRF